MQRYWLDAPRTRKLAWGILILALVATVLAEFVVHLHPHFAIESVFGFHALLALLACTALIVLAWLVGFLLRRADTYYAVDDE